MKNIKIIHIPDMHMDPKYLDKIKPSLDQILNYCSCEKVNAVVIPGDVWHTKQSYSNNSAVPELIKFLRDLSSMVDFIFITKGNHDEAGSISLLHQLESNIYAYEYPVVLGIVKNDDYSVWDILRNEPDVFDKFEYFVSLVPYPTKAGFITETSIDNNNADFLEKFEQLFELIGDVTEQYTCPKILGFHGNVVGSRLSTGQTLVSQDIMVAPSTLEKAKADYYALNHIHLDQEIKPYMIYAGGLANFNWGETEQKSFRVAEFSSNEGLERTERIYFEHARPMIKYDCEYTDSMIEVDGFDIFSLAVEDAQYRIRIKVSENERKLITEDTIQDIKNHYGQDTKIEFNIVPAERESRSEKIMQCKTLLDEVIEFAKVTEFDLTDSIKEKVESLQGEKVTQ